MFRRLKGRPEEEMARKDDTETVFLSVSVIIRYCRNQSSFDCS